MRVQNKFLVSVLTGALVLFPVGSSHATAPVAQYAATGASGGSTTHWNSIFGGSSFAIPDAESYLNSTEYLAAPGTSRKSDAFDGWGYVHLIIGGTSTELTPSNCSITGSSSTSANPNTVSEEVVYLCDGQDVVYGGGRSVATKVKITLKENWVQYEVQAKLPSGTGALKVSISGNLGSDGSTIYQTPVSNTRYWVTTEGANGGYDPILGWRTSVPANLLNAINGTAPANSSDWVYFQTINEVAIGTSFQPVFSVETAVVGFDTAGFETALGCTTDLIQNNIFGSATPFYLDSSVPCILHAGTPAASQVAAFPTVNQPKLKYVAKGQSFDFTGSLMNRVISVTCNGLDSTID